MDVHVNLPIKIQLKGKGVVYRADGSIKTDSNLVPAELKEIVEKKLEEDKE